MGRLMLTDFKILLLRVSRKFLATTTTTTILQPFAQDYPGEPVPEETFTHPPS